VSAPDWLAHRVVVCVGTGGVGKTTVSAAIALEAARRGRRALVLTIDPARRLADAIGAGELGHEPREVPREVLRRAGVEGDGALCAMMLDTKRTFDELVRRYAPDTGARERIFANPIYQNLTDALAGTREYSAMEKLYEIHASGAYDLIVVDTPPARHALEFLEAPRRLTGFLESQILRLLFRPAAAMGRAGFRLFRFGSATILRTIERVSGVGFLSAISEFLLVFESMLDGFARRAREVEALLSSPECGFLLVVGPDADQATRAEEFWRQLDREGVSLIGAILNRARTWPGEGEIPDAGPEARRAAVTWLTERLSASLDGDAGAAARALVGTAATQASLARRDTDTRDRLRRSLPLDSQAVRAVPLFAEDVHRIEGLARIGEHLFDGDAGG
jgi:anion-transporting  ArsA/GET3 family ATPase